MPDIDISSLSHMQYRTFQKVMEVLGDPGDFENSIETVQIIDAIRHWYLARQQQLRAERHER